MGHFDEFFDSRMTKFEEYLESVAPENVPIVLLLDNINLYKGKRRQLRLFKYIAPIDYGISQDEH